MKHNTIQCNTTLHYTIYYIILYYIILYYIILYYIILYYDLMGPPSYTRSVVDRNVVMRRIPVPMFQWILQAQSWGAEVTFFLKTEAAGSSETSILTHHDTCCRNMELHNPYIHRCESTHFHSNRIHQAGRPASLPYSITFVIIHIYPKIHPLSIRPYWVTVSAKEPF